MASRRILVLGSFQSIKKVEFHRWDNIPEGLNVADYDIVILNFRPFEIPVTARSINIDKIPSFAQFARLLFSKGSEIIVIGNPFFRLGDNPYLESTWWLPIIPVFLHEQGETINLKDDNFAFYFKNVRRWSFCFEEWLDRYPDFFSEYMLESGIRGADNLEPSVHPIAENRYSRPIGFAFYLKANSNYYGELGESCWVTWLPPTTEISGDEAIKLLLRESFKIPKEEITPNWAEQYHLPNELPIRQRIEKLENDITTLNKKVQKARQDLDVASRFKKLLYETGEEVLEPIVLDTLRELKGKVQLPKVKGKEDGRLTDPSGRIATLEIKGRSGTLRVKDIREAHQWVADSIAYENRKSKGILIANLKNNQPPGARGEVFPPNCIELAQNFCISLVTTTQLFKALILQQEGKLELSEFWDSVFKADGICKFPELK